MNRSFRQSERRKPSVDANSKVSESWTQLVISEVNRLNDDDPATVYLKEQFLTKFVSDETDPAEVRRSRAISKWLATEAENAATNDRLLNTRGEYNILPRVSWNKWLSVVRSTIRDIIGGEPILSELYCSFSGGATTSKSRTESHPASKYLGEAHITSAARPYFEQVLNWTYYGWKTYSRDLSLKEVPGNVLFTVPKSTHIDRCCAKEPDLNMFLQKGVGGFIRRRLKYAGIDLNDQTRNQRLARRGSIDGSLATMDLSSASDSMSRVLVWLVLPHSWWRLMDDLRSPITSIDGEEHVNEMFSSMGNGFTFELESLLFYAIAKATAYCTGVRGVISVYGDDIIVPSTLFDDLAWTLGWCGFSVNPEKSFHSGPFRESCGGHYHNGRDVTPFYLRRPIKRLTDLIHLGNQIRRWSANFLVGPILCVELEELWALIRDEIPQSLRGGRELGSITQLVTPDLPSHHLVARTKKEELSTGGFLLWLNSTDGRDVVGEHPVETSIKTEVLTVYRKRPVIKTGYRQLHTRFLTELE